MTLSNFNDTQNKQLVTTAIDELKLNPLTDAIPRQVIPTIQPTFELKRKISYICKRTSAVNATSATIYTTPSDKDFYITSAFLSNIKDASATAISSNIQVIIEGNSINLLSIVGLTGTASTGQISNSYSYPIKVDRSSAITVTNSTNVGNVTSAGGITGYLEESGPQFI